MSDSLPTSDDAEIQFTREYRNSTIAQRDMAKYAATGLHVMSTTSINQSPGCLRWLLLGWLSLIFKPEPHVLVVYRGKASVQQAMLRTQQAELDLLRSQQRAALIPHTPLQRWLHTPVGALAVLAAFALSLALMPLFRMDTPYLLPLVSIFLAIADWHNFSSFHGAIPWKVWKFEGHNWSYYGLGTIVWLYGWLFMPVVYAIQAWSEAKTLRKADREAVVANIAALEAELLPPTSASE